MLGQIDIHNAGAVGDIPNDQTACIVGLLGNPFHIAQFACFEIHVRERDHGNLVEIIERTRARYPDARIILAGMEAPPNLGPIYTAAFRQVFADIAQTHDVALVPFLLDGVAGVPELNQDDRIHPTEDGHAVVARTVWPYLADVLRRDESPS